jgi:hypothetical protein
MAKQVYRWTSWVVVAREPDGSEWLAATGFDFRRQARIEIDETLRTVAPRCKFVTRPVSNEVELALPKRPKKVK